MPKPTLVQFLLNKPSQSYATPPSKQYYSSKQELIRIATATHVGPHGVHADFLQVPSADAHIRRSLSTSHAARPVGRIDGRPQRRATERARRTVHFVEEGAPSDGAPAELLPDRTLIRQIASSQDVPSQTHRVQPESQYLSPLPPPPHIERPPVDSTPATPAGPHDDSGRSEDDMFYTPRPSPRTSRSSTLVLLDSHALANALAPLHSAAAPPSLDTTPAMPGEHLHSGPSSPVSRTPSDSSLSSKSSSTSGHDVESIFSSSCATTSTGPTTPGTSENGILKMDEDAMDPITISATRRSRPPPSPTGSSPTESPRGSYEDPGQPPDSAKAVTQNALLTAPVPDLPIHYGAPLVRPRPVSMSGTVSPQVEAIRVARRRSQVEARSTTYTDADWAKEVKMGVPRAKQATAPAPRRMSRPLHPDLLPPIASSSRDSQQPTPRPHRPSRPKEHRNSRHSQRHSRARMSALWEEDESEYSTAPSSAEPSRAPTPVHFAESLRSLTPPSTAPSSPGPLHPLFLSNTNPMDKYMEDSPIEEPEALVEYARLRGSLRPSPMRSPLASDSSPALVTVPTYSLPTPYSNSSPDIAASGYTSLTLPRATYVNKKGRALREGEVDLVRAGVAQSSMATVEIVRGASLSTSSGFSLFKPKRKVERRRSIGKRESITPAHLRGGLPLPVAFMSHLPPPSFCPPSHVLVQVFAVGLDGLDSILVQEKVDARQGAGSAGSLGRKRKAGFIPGRSFVGRALECGFEVKDEVCKRGDWVVGLLDVRKCGALAEFILVERHRVFRSPQPRARPVSMFPQRRRNHTRTMSLPSGPNPKFTSSPLAPPAPLSLEELALLPLVGLQAHRAVRTFADVLSGPKQKDLELRPRVLILQGHDGPGALAVQMVARKGVRVFTQVPESAVADADESQQPGARRVRVETRLRQWGAEEICVGEPLEVIERFVEENGSFDAVLDTVGGVAIWEAAQRMLMLSPSAAAAKHASKSSPTFSVVRPNAEDAEDKDKDKQRSRISQAQFTTLVGDTPNRAVPKAQDNLKSGFRSLRRAITTGGQAKGTPSKVLGKKAVRRTVGYTWVSVAADVDFEGEDVRDTLHAVVGMVEEGSIRPWAGIGDSEEQDGKVLPFEQVPEVFRRDVAGPVGVLKDGGTCVVKITG